MSDHALKLVMPLINVHRDMACGPKQSGLKSSQLCCLGCSSTDGLSVLTIHDSQPAEAGDRPWVEQTAAAFGWLIALLVSGVARLDASSSSKADTLNIWCRGPKNCET